MRTELEFYPTYNAETLNRHSSLLFIVILFLVLLFLRLFLLFLLFFLVFAPGDLKRFHVQRFYAIARPQTKDLAIVGSQVDTVGQIVGNRNGPVGKTVRCQRRAATAVQDKKLADPVESINIVGGGGENAGCVAIGPG